MSCRLFQLSYLLLAISFAVSQPLSADEARRAATWRSRRVIFNNDGDDSLHYEKWHQEDGLQPPETDGFLSVRINHCFGTGVESVFFCTHHWSPPNLKVNDGGNPDPRIKQGFDALDVVVRECRRRNIEAIWSLRVNDIHDTYFPTLMPQWKKDYPHLLMGIPKDKNTYPVADPRSVWTFADFALPDVRDMIVTLVDETLTHHDVDGMELDFLRHPAHFKETLIDKSATQEHMDMLTDMVGRVRKEVLAASERRGRPVLLSVRVLPTMRQNRHWGFDVERWVRDRYVDFITVGGGYDPFTVPVKDIVEQGHQWGIPVYVCLSVSGFSDAVARVPGSTVSSSVKCWRAAAANAWQAGADGIMTFNLFPRFSGTRATNTARQVWNEIGDPDLLVRKNKIYCIENVDELWAVGFMVRSVPRVGRLPVELRKGGTVECTMPVGDRVAASADQLKSLRLRVCVSVQPANRESFAVTMNGTKLDAIPEKPQWLVADVPASAMAHGNNFIAVRYRDGEQESVQVIGMELLVAYN